MLGAAFVGTVPRVAASARTKVTAPVIEDVSKGPGSNLNLTLQVWNVGPLPEDMDAWQVRLKLDPGILKITKLFPGPVLHQIADDFGGSVFDTLHFNATAGTVDANELLDLSTPPSPQPVDAGWTGSAGDLLYIQVQVLAIGVSNITITQNQLNDIDGRDVTRIPIRGCFSREVCNGLFTNVPGYNVRPVVNFTFTLPIIAGQNVTFDASASLDRDNDAITLYSWNFGDSTPVVQTTNATLNHIYTDQGGPLTVTLNVTDGRGAVGTTQYAGIFVNPPFHPPIAIIEFTPANPTAGQLITFNASKSYDIDNDLTPPPGSLRLPFKWDFGDNSTTGGVAPVHKYDLPGSYIVTLTAEDTRRLVTHNSTIVTVGAGSLPPAQVSVLPPWAVPAIAAAAAVGGVGGLFLFVRRRGRTGEPETEEDFL